MTEDNLREAQQWIKANLTLGRKGLNTKTTCYTLKHIMEDDTRKAGREIYTSEDEFSAALRSCGFAVDDDSGYVGVYQREVKDLARRAGWTV